ncbi:MAG: ribonuclease HI [Aestuariivita sp.]|nr:ribonuclease HI [Aestuariivita sp.]
MLEFHAYTDGACSGNPGCGGWGVVLLAQDGNTLIKEREISGGAPHTTNNRMELLAAITALEALSKPVQITVYTDSTYVKNGVNSWMQKWKANGWKTATKSPVKNQDLWKRLDVARTKHKVTWKWIKGHAGHSGNERADRLARSGMQPFKEKTSIDIMG